MKTTFVVATLVSLIVSTFIYGTSPRETRTYENMQPTELHTVLCIFDNGEADTYHIVMPSFEGFTTEDVTDLENSYAQGFCDSLR